MTKINPNPDFVAEATALLAARERLRIDRSEGARWMENFGSSSAKGYDFIWQEYVAGTALEPKVLPRKIVGPGDYDSARVFGASFYIEMVSQMEIMEAGLVDAPLLCNYAASVKCLLAGCPTYFVDSNFAEAIMQTDAPRCLHMNQIKWPLESMNFIFPRKFIAKWPLPVGNVRVARIHAGEIFDPCLLTNRGRAPSVEIQDTGAYDKMLIVWNIFDYQNPSYMGMPMNVMMRLNINDELIEEQAALMKTYTRQDGILFQTPEDIPSLTGEQEEQFVEDFSLFLIKLIVAMSTREDRFISPGECVRVARPSKNRLALWSPNFIGRGYAPKRETQGGSHASPRTHFRRGHLRNQPIGSRHEPQHKIIWIEPATINA